MMVTTPYSVTIGNFTYEQFPVYDEIVKLRKDAVQKLMAFFRAIGLGTPKQINTAIGNGNNDDRIERLLKRIGVAVSISEEAIQENIRETEEMQRRIVGDGGEIFRYHVKMCDIVAKVEGIHYHDPEKALREVLTACGYKISSKGSKEEKPGKKSDDAESAEEPEPVQEPESVQKPEPVQEPAQESKPAQNSEPARKPDLVQEPELTQEPEPTQDSGSNVDAELEAFKPVVGEKIDHELAKRVLEYTRNCPLDVQRAKGHTDVLYDKEYMEALYKYFPYISYEMIRDYLLNTAVTTQYIGIMARRAGIEKVNIRNPQGQEREKVILQRAAFVAWTGGDWQKYLSMAIKTAKENEAKMRQGHEDYYLSTQPKKATHSKANVPAHDEGGKSKQSEPERHPKDAGENTTPAPTIPKTTPNTRSTHCFRATIQVSTTLDRSKIEDLIIHIMKEVPSVDLDGYKITCEE